MLFYVDLLFPKGIHDGVLLWPRKRYTSTSISQRDVDKLIENYYVAAFYSWTSVKVSNK